MQPSSGGQKGVSSWYSGWKLLRETEVILISLSPAEQGEEAHQEPRAQLIKIAVLAWQKPRINAH